jgi:hypothetical protein
MPTTNADIDSFGDRGPLLRWLVFTGLCIFAFILLWRFGLIRQMVASESHLSLFHHRLPLCGGVVALPVAHDRDLA